MHFFLLNYATYERGHHFGGSAFFAFGLALHNAENKKSAKKAAKSCLFCNKLHSKT